MGSKYFPIKIPFFILNSFYTQNNILFLYTETTYKKQININKHLYDYARLCINSKASDIRNEQSSHISPRIRSKKETRR